MKSEGKTNQEIADKLGFANKWVVKDFIKRENRKINRNNELKVPLSKGRPRKNQIVSQKDLEKENKRLKMENELLRDFLKEIERS